MPDDRQAKWRVAVNELTTRRADYTPERLAYYDRIADQCLHVLQPTGDVLDVGAGDGSMWRKLMRRNDEVTSYVGLDPGATGTPAGGVWLSGSVYHGTAEALPFGEQWFDTVLFYSVLQHVLDPSRALAEAYRVLVPGGRLALQASVEDSNPLFMWHWSAAEVVSMVAAADFVVEAVQVFEGRMVCVRGRKT